MHTAGFIPCALPLLNVMDERKTAFEGRYVGLGLWDGLSVSQTILHTGKQLTVVNDR